MAERFRLSQDRVEALEVQNEINQNKATDCESKLKIMEDMYNCSKGEFEDACIKIQNSSNTSTNFELLCEHRLTKIKDLEREVRMKENKILEFRDRFDMATQKLLNKDEVLRDTRLEREKIDTEFQIFKQLMLNESKEEIEVSTKSARERKLAKKNKWVKRREFEEKSFIDANDYVLVCKKLKEVKSEHSLMIIELKQYKQQLQALSTSHDEITVKNENMSRKADTFSKIIEQLNDQKVDIQYKADNILKTKTQEFGEELNRLQMLVEDINMKYIGQNDKIISIYCSFYIFREV
jgi:hypothetical protein